MSTFDRTLQSAKDAGFSDTADSKGSVQGCPFDQADPRDPTKSPCYVAVMNLSAVKLELREDRRKQKDVSGDKVEVIYKHGTTPGLPDEVVKHLGGDDLLMQVISATEMISPVQVKVPGTDTLVHTFDDSYSNNQPLTVFADVTTWPKCGEGQHPMNVAYEAKMPLARDVFGAGKKRFQVIAPKGGNLLSRNIWSLLWPFSPSSPNTYYVEAHSCGISDNAYEVPPPKRVRGRIEVFRKKSVQVKVKLPSMRTISRKKASYRNLKSGEKMSELSVSETKAFGKIKESSSVIEGKRSDGTRSTYIKVTETTTDTGYIQSAKEEHTFESTGGQSFKTTHKSESSSTKHTLFRSHTKTTRSGDWEAGEEYVTDKNDGTDVLKPFSRPVKDDDFKPEELSSAMRAGVEIFINGKRVNVHILGALLNLPAKAKAFITEIKEAVPKVGWWAEFDMRLLTSEMTITGSMAPAAKGIHDRVWLLERHATFQYKGELLAVSASFALGFEFTIKNVFASSPLINIVAKIQFGFDKSFDLILDFDSRRMLEAEPKLVTKNDAFYAEIVGEASICGYGYKASGKLTLGFKFALEGRISAHRENELKGNLSYAGLIAKFEVCEHGEVKATKTVPIGSKKPKELWRGDIIGGSRTSGDMKAKDASAKAAAI